MSSDRRNIFSKIKDALSRDSKFANELDEIIEALKNLHQEGESKTQEELYNKIVSQVMAVLAEAFDFPEFDELNQTEKRHIIEIFTQIIQEACKKKLEEKLKQEQEIDIDEALSRLIDEISNTLAHKKQKDKEHNKHKEDSQWFLSDQQKKALKEQLTKMAIYEEYKILNPNRLAGETKEQNFMNNMMVGGLKRALQYEGKELVENKDIKNAGDKLHSTFLNNKPKGESKGR